MINDRLNQIKDFLNSDEAALITDSNNRFYFSGMSSSAGSVLITKDASYLLIDFRYYEKAKNTVNDCTVLLCEKLYIQLTELLKKHNIKKVLCESDTLTVSAFNSIKENLDDYEVSASGGLSEKIRKLRSIKSAQEIEISRLLQMSFQVFYMGVVFSI